MVLPTFNLNELGHIIKSFDFVRTSSIPFIVPNFKLLVHLFDLLSAEPPTHNSFLYLLGVDVIVGLLVNRCSVNKIRL